MSIRDSNKEDGSVLLRETGDDGSYAEGWLRVPGSETGPFFALTLVSEGGQGRTHSNNARTGYWVRAGNRFAYAVGLSPIHIPDPPRLRRHLYDGVCFVL